jgi:hypothetical protein
LKNIVATLIAIGKTRAELLVTELEEEKIRLHVALVEGDRCRLSCWRSVSMMARLLPGTCLLGTAGHRFRHLCLALFVGGGLFWPVR